MFTWLGRSIPTSALGGIPRCVFVCCLPAISVFMSRWAVVNNDELCCNEYIYPWWVYVVVIEIALYLLLVREFFIIVSKLTAIEKKSYFLLLASEKTESRLYSYQIRHTTDEWKNVTTKISKSVGVMRRLHCQLPADVMVKLYYSLVYSHLTFALSGMGKIGTYECC